MFEIGSSLRDARVRQGLDLLQLEQETKIRSKYLRALEEERFDLLPGDAYVKGFLRTYAERLGLDGQLYVDEYNSRFALAEEPVFSARPGRRSRRQRRLESHAVLIALAGIVAVTVLVIAAWQLGGSASGPSATGTPAVPPSSLDEAASAPPPATEPEPAAPSLELVVQAVRGSSVVEVRRSSATGELLFEGTIEQGRSETFAARKKLWLRLSRPQNLDFELNGTAIGGVSATGPSIVVATADGIRPVEAP